MKILIVEDDRQAASYLYKSIKSWGHEIEIAESCREALIKIEEGVFHIILLDIFLPDGHGYNLIPKIKEMLPDAYIISMTGENSKELEAKVRGCGITYYLIKPFEIQYLESIISHIFQLHETKTNIGGAYGR